MENILNSKSRYRHWFFLLLFCLFWLLFLTNFGVKFDQKISLDIYNCFDSKLATDFFILVSKYTLGGLIGIFVLFGYMAHKKDRRAVLITSLLFILMSIFYVSFNDFTSRLRPFDAHPFVDQLVTSDWMWEFSFPSGHSTFAFFIAYFLSNRYQLSPKIKAILYLLAFMVALSRVYLGMHYVIDVVAGACLGLFFGEVGMKLIKK